MSTPDGTKYRFGGEFNPDDTDVTTNDQNSAWYMPIYDQSICAGFTGFLCNKVWRWNLDRVEDPNGNILNYYYTLEMNYYSSNTLGSDLRREYVRAGNLVCIDYGMRKGNAITIPTHVVFQLEDRCDGPCTTTAPRPDTPSDLACTGS